MPAFTDENPQFIDPITSKPIVNGTVFFGVQGEDPEAVPITVYSDRNLNIPLVQPLKTDASGRTTPTPVFLPERFSFKVREQAGAVKLINLDAGVAETLGTTRLTNVVGGTTITAQSDPPTTAYENGAKFSFTAVSINTGAMTLDINGVGPRGIKFNFNEVMKGGFVQAQQTVNVTYNSLDDHFDWDNAGRGVSILTNIGGTGNAITADGGPSITGYVDQQLFVFKASANNTGAVTLKVGALAPITMKSMGNAIAPSQLIQNILYIVAYNSIGPVFELVSGAGNAVSPSNAVEGNISKFGANPLQLVDSLVSSLGPLSIQKFDGNGTWTRPANVKSVLVFLVAGGGGASGSTASVGGGAGGAASTSISFIAAAAATYAVVIGGGGAGGTAGPTAGNGGAGGASTIGGTIVTTSGGSGGNSTTGGSGGTGGTGDLAIGGGSGSDSSTIGGAGGNSFFGGGGGGTIAGAKNANGFGSGGGGAAGNGNRTGGVGKGGVAFFLEFG